MLVLKFLLWWRKKRKKVGKAIVSSKCHIEHAVFAKIWQLGVLWRKLQMKHISKENNNNNSCSAFSPLKRWLKINPLPIVTFPGYSWVPTPFHMRHGGVLWLPFIHLIGPFLYMARAEHIGVKSWRERQAYYHSKLLEEKACTMW